MKSVTLAFNRQGGVGGAFGTLTVLFAFQCVGKLVGSRFEGAFFVEGFLAPCVLGVLLFSSVVFLAHCILGVPIFSLEVCVAPCVLGVPLFHRRSF
jgi:hypothetical protein